MGRGRRASSWLGWGRRCNWPPMSELRVLDGARHEVFNELGKEEVIDLVARFAERVTAR